MKCKDCRWFNHALVASKEERIESEEKVVVLREQLSEAIKSNKEKVDEIVGTFTDEHFLAHAGQCQRFPPVQSVEEVGDTEIGSGWPDVQDFYWCGEFTQN